MSTLAIIITTVIITSLLNALGISLISMEIRQYITKSPAHHACMAILRDYGVQELNDAIGYLSATTPVSSEPAEDFFDKYRRENNMPHPEDPIQF